ncbi:hypothetical protein IMAU10062_03086 [Lactiplantibacillus plantarum]|nr:hypothetical protein [Lactiplantibacillus plantarum]
MAQISVGDRVKCQKNGNTDYDFYPNCKNKLATR